MADEYSNFMRRERARIEREDWERAQALQEARSQAEREQFLPLLTAESPIRLVVVYKKIERGFRAEVVGLHYACEADTKATAREGVLDLVKRQAKHQPRQVLEAARVMATAEVVSLDLNAKGSRRTASKRIAAK